MTADLSSSVPPNDTAPAPVEGGDDLVARLLELDAKRTKGPWWLFDENHVLAVRSPQRKSQNEIIHWSGFDASHYPKKAKANAAFIVALENALPKLIDTITSLTRRVEQAERERDEARERVSALMNGADRYWEARWRDANAELTALRSTAAKALPTEEEIARVLYGCERERGEIANSIMSAATGREITGCTMEPWEECKDAFLSDARAVLALLAAAPKPQTVAEDALVEALRKLEELDAKRTKGPWSTEFDPLSARWIMAFGAWPFGSRVAEVDHRTDAAFIVALENTWPILRAALQSNAGGGK